MFLRLKESKRETLGQHGQCIGDRRDIQRVSCHKPYTSPCDHTLAANSPRRHPCTPYIRCSQMLQPSRHLENSSLQPHHTQHNSRVRMTLVLGYWLLGNIHRYWAVLLLGNILLLFWHPIEYQSDSSQHRPHASEWLFSSACDLYSDRHNRLSGHHADMPLFTKCNHHHHHRVLRFFVAIAMLYTSIGIVIGYWYRYRPTLLGIGYWVPFLVSF